MNSINVDEFEKIISLKNDLKRGKITPNMVPARQLTFVNMLLNFEDKELQKDIQDLNLEKDELYKKMEELINEMENLKKG